MAKKNRPGPRVRERKYNPTTPQSTHHPEIALVIRHAEGHVAQGVGARDVLLCWLGFGLVVLNGVGYPFCAGAVSVLVQNIHTPTYIHIPLHIYPHTRFADGVAPGEHAREEHVVVVKDLGLVVEGAGGVGRACDVADLPSAARAQVRDQVVGVHYPIYRLVVWVCGCRLSLCK